MLCRNITVYTYNNCIHIMNMLIHISLFCNYKCIMHSDSLSFLQLNSQMLGTVVCGTPGLMIFQQLRRILMMLVSGDDLHGWSRMIWRANCGVPWHRTAQTSKNDVEFWPTLRRSATIAWLHAIQEPFWPVFQVRSERQWFSNLVLEGQRQCLRDVEAASGRVFLQMHQHENENLQTLH